MDYPGRESNILDAVAVSVGQFAAPPVPLPAGPRAIVLITDGTEDNSSADFNVALQSAIDQNVSIFTVGVGDFTSTTSQRILNNLPRETGGDFYPTSGLATISGACVQISRLLSNEYLLTFASPITDCNSHTLEVLVAGQAAPITASFKRCATVFVPDLRGMTSAEATTALSSVGMVVGTATQQISESPIGTVLSQAPTLGAVATPGGKVNLVLSSGIPPSAYALSPTSLAFGQQALNLRSTVRTIVLSNAGSLTLPISSITLGGTNPGQFARTHNCGSSVPAGGKCTITVTFKPTSVGLKSAKLSVNAGNGAGTKTVSLSGTGVMATFSIAPDSLSFGSVLRGVTSAAKTVTVTNTATVALPMTSVALAGTSPGQFSQTNNCPAQVAVGGKCTVSVKFKPTSTGSKSATLVVTPGGGAAAKSVALYGTGI